MPEPVSTLPVIQLDTIRHPKMAAVPAPYLERMVDELAVDQKLGLEIQAKIDSQELFKRDVDELTRSNDYYQVTSDLISKMFQMGSLKFRCFRHNVVEFLFKTTRELALGVSLCAVSCAAIWPAVLFFVQAAHTPKNEDGSGWAMLGALCCIATVVGIVFSFIYTFRKTRQLNLIRTDRDGEREITRNVQGLFFDYYFLKVDLKMEKIKETSVKIPFPVKCKILEAQEKGIFKDFVIGYPRFDIEHKEFNVKLPEMPRNADPVVLGMSHDGRMFLIAWWDIKHDIDKVKNNIKFFKKFKVVV